jgi:hypothetical protein
MPKRTFEEYMKFEESRVIKPIVKQLYIGEVTYYPRGPDEIVALAWSVKDVNIATAKYYNSVRDRHFDKEFDISAIDHTDLIPWLTAQPDGACTMTITTSLIKNERNCPTMQEQLKKASPMQLKDCLSEAGVRVERKTSKKKLMDMLADVVVGQEESK